MAGTTKASLQNTQGKTMVLPGLHIPSYSDPFGKQKTHHTSLGVGQESHPKDSDHNKQ